MAGRQLQIAAKSRRGVTLVELLVVSAIFLVVLGALGSLFSGTTRAYRVTTERSEGLQDSEAVLQLLRYDLGRAGFRGVDDGAFDRSFSSCTTDDIAAGDLGTGAACQTVRVQRDAMGAAGDIVTVRFFETRFAGGGDGERVVSYYVSAADNALMRQEGALTAQLLVGNVVRLQILDFVDRSRDAFGLDVLVGLFPDPNGSDGERLWPDGLRELAGLNVEVEFVDESTAEFMVGLHNAQLFGVLQGASANGDD